jgi:hypothetical protein
MLGPWLETRCVIKRHCFMLVLFYFFLIFLGPFHSRIHGRTYIDLKRPDMARTIRKVVKRKKKKFPGCLFKLVMK